MDNIEALRQPEKFAQGIFLELYGQDGALATPMWVSLRDRPVLTKQINQATVFESPEAALNILSRLGGDDIHLSSNNFLTVSSRTYNKEVHQLFWERLQQGAKAEGGPLDYSHYLIECQQKLEQLNHALINGPEELARALAKELFVSVLDLNIAVDRLLNN